MKRSYWSKIALVALIVVALAAAARVPGRVSQAQGGIMIDYESSVFGSAAPNTPPALYNFNGTAGDLVNVDVEAVDDTLEPTVELIGPDGQTLAASQHNRLETDTNSAQLAQFLPQTGVYALRVGGANGTAGDFVLRLRGRGPVASTDLVFGQSVPVTIPLNAMPQHFSFEAQNCPTTLTVTNQSDGLPYTFPFVVKVRNPQGQIIAQLRGGDAQEDRVTVAPLSGRYEVDVLSDDPAVQGTISLLVSCAGGAPGCAAAGGEAVPGEGPICAACPDCFPDDVPDDPGDEPACPVMNLVLETEVGAAILSWDPVPGAESYWVHVYELGADAEVHLGSVELPPDTLVYNFGLPDIVPDVDGYRFLVETRLGEDLSCQEDITLMFRRVRELCENFNVTGEVSGPPEPTFTITWDEYPGADGYILSWRFTSLDGSEVHGFGAAYIHDTTFTGHLPVVDPPSGILTYQVGVVVDGEVICEAEDSIVLAVQQVIPLCPDMAPTWTDIDPAVHGGTLSWNVVPGADRYAIRWYGMTADGEESFGVLPVPDGATSYTFDHMPPGYTSFRFVIEAIDAAGAVICEDVFEMRIVEQGPDECGNFTAGITSHTGSAVTFEWSEYPGVEFFSFYIVNEAGDLLPGYPLLLSAVQHRVDIDWLEPGTYTFGIGPWSETEGLFCLRTVMVVIEASLEGQVAQPEVECTIRTDRRDVRVHVGPGRSRSVFTFLTPGMDYTVIGQATDADGNLWWQIDKTQIPGHEAAISLWVAANDVSESGACDQVPPADVPPVIPGGPAAVPQEGWGACGSCDTCGHPANECVTSPEGACLWDPTTCQGVQPGDLPSGQGGCFSIGRASNPSYGGSVTLLTAPNCVVGAMNPVEPGDSMLTGMSLQLNGYTAGTVVQVQANPASGYPYYCTFASWSGCGAGGSSNPTSFTVTGSCVITANFNCQ